MTQPLVEHVCARFLTLAGSHVSLFWYGIFEPVLTWHRLLE